MLTGKKKKKKKKTQRLDNGAEVRLQRNALTVTGPPTGDESVRNTLFRSLFPERER